MSFLSSYLLSLLSDGSFPLLPSHSSYSVTAAWWLRLCRDATSEWGAAWVTHWSDTVCLIWTFDNHANTQTLHRHKFVIITYYPVSTHSSRFAAADKEKSWPQNKILVFGLSSTAPCYINMLFLMVFCSRGSDHRCTTTSAQSLQSDSPLPLTGGRSLLILLLFLSVCQSVSLLLNQTVSRHGTEMF